ncbi:putative ribonuclease H-like domain-containing protein [Tanacetum coccineum]|uniref:Ribonuclease H-like domain-containing protein n=1 Tax=Tanacetum coccineum TaxID=301880 RepID=A0ABQ5EPP0_9ASTR
MGSHTLQQLKKLYFDEVKELFKTTMERVNTFTPIESDDTVPKVVARSSKIDVEQELNQESSKRQKIGEGSEPAKESKNEMSREQLQQLMIIVPEEGINVEALQTKYPIINWEVYTEDSRKYRKIIRVELKRLFEPDDDDTLWKLQRYMHDPLKWKLYDTCVVHHVSTERGHDIFMMVEKDYPLTRGLMTLMLSNKLQVDEYSVMANELLRKIFILANRLRYFMESRMQRPYGKLSRPGFRNSPANWKFMVKLSPEDANFVAMFDTDDLRRDGSSNAPVAMLTNKVVATKSGLVQVNAAKQSSPRAAASISTARHISTVSIKPKVNAASPIKYYYFKAHSPLRRPFNQKSVAKTNNFNKKVYTAKVNNVTIAGPEIVVSTAERKRENAVESSACWIWRPTGKVIDHISKDSGSYMPKRFDYVDPQGRLKKISVLFTATDFMLYLVTLRYWIESQVLLNVPRQNNMYSFVLIILCLREGKPVRGLPLKLFENDHTCVACQKGKHHKASCKPKLVCSIREPLQMLHMDLFGPTSVRSTNHKTYCLVVTDDYSRIKGIKREFSVARTPQQNGVVERKNWTLIEAARTMLADSLLPTTSE